MAKLQKLEISGIRSFSPYTEEAQQISFHSPVTLILGMNGCGKTTIIEALKYVCSGELPSGTNNGHGFVHDPKINGTSSTKGQIKLKFTDPKGCDVTVSRVVELTQTNTNMKFASKSAVIRRQDKDGRDSALPSRCADTNTECCLLMNVPPAVLNNVIFCHQENSSWPLDEGQKLKEKFDRIFDAQKYNDCSNYFREQLKAREVRIKTLTLEVSYAKEKKQEVEKQTRNLHDKEDRLREFEEQIEDKKKFVEPIKSRIDEIHELENSLGKLQLELTKLKATRDGVAEEQNTIKKSLQSEFTGDDSDLHRKIQSFEKDRQNDKNKILELEAQMKQIEEKNKEIAAEMKQGQIQLGSLKKLKDQFEERCNQRLDLFNEAKAKLELPGLVDFDTHEGANRALSVIEADVENQEMLLCGVVCEVEMQEQHLQSISDKARDKTISTKQLISSKEKEVDENKLKIDELSRTLEGLSASDDLLEDAERKIQNVKATIAKLQDTFKEHEEAKRAESYTENLERIKNSLEKLENEHRMLAQNDIAEGQIEREKRVIMEKKREINRLRTKHSKSLQKLFGETVPQKTLKEDILAKQKEAENKASSLQEKLNRKQREVTTLEVKCQNQREKIAICEKELKLNREKIFKVCGGQDYKEVLQNSFQRKERLQIDKGQYSSIRIIYGQFVKKFEEENPCCPVCETTFNGKQSVVQKIKTTLKSKLDRIPQQLERVEAELKKEEALYTELQQLKLVNEEIEQLSKEKLPQLKKELEDFESFLSRNSSELSSFKTQLEEPEKVLEICKTVISDVSGLDQNFVDVEKSERAINDLKQTLVQVPSKKSKQEVEAEIDQLKSESTDLRSKLDTHNKKVYNHRERIQKLTQEKAGLIDSKLQMIEKLQSKPHLEEQREEISEKVEDLKSEIESLKLTLISQEQELKKTIEDKDEYSKKGKVLVSNQQEKIQKVKKYRDDLRKIQEEIQKYIRDDIETKLQITESVLKECKNKETSLEEAKTKVLHQINQKNKSLAEHEIRFRNLQDNLLLRQKIQEEKKLGKEIQDLEKRIGGYNYRRVHEERLQLEDQHARMEGEIKSLSGEKNQMSREIQELREDLEQPKKKKAYSHYMSKFYELKIAECVISELKVFISALEKAILQFHKAKMVQINRNIRDLWRTTYRGNDIDHIEIKTEHASGRSTKRSYNYKVVQIKKGVELDMRGRCSAGQKVLACLIIRMALAETLSSNCGILALDEPTTNLDKDNVLSLCDTLSRIINNRRKEKAFQLLIITHDEEFLNVLTRAQDVPYYYRIGRNNKGFSVINRERL